jgi:hypothetical protein
MLEIAADHWYAWDFTVTRDGQPITRLEMSTWRERCGFVLDGARYETASAGFLSGEYTLQGPDGPLATALKQGAGSAPFVVHVGSRTLTVERRSWLKWGVDVSERGVPVGSIAPTSTWSRDATAELPDDLPLAVQLFVICLALITAKREIQTIAASS